MKNLGAGPILAMYANLGYALVATDYSGLGSDLGKSVEDMQSNALDLMYSIPAARAAVPEIGTKWIALGTYQGARAVAAVAESDVRDPNYLGSVAVSGLSDAADDYKRFARDSTDRMLVLASTLQALYPEFSLSNMLTSEGMLAYQRFTQSCGGDVALDLRGTTLRPGWENDRFVKEFFSGNMAGQRAARGPILVIAGGADGVIPAESTATTVSRMCKAGDRVDFLQYPNLDASGVMAASAADQISWIKARFAGNNAPNNCH
jgi:pimeloyl-ACP methyl ester carboxylesterase